MSRRHETLSRDLGLFDVTMIGVGAMIGAGIFVLTGEAAGVAGPALLLAFALNGVVAILTAMVYAELGSAIPEAGGGYLWIKEGLPGANAFLAGWMSWFAHAVAGALYALGFGAFVYELLRLLGTPVEGLGLDLTLGKKLFGVAVALVFAFINYRGSSETGMAGNIVTLAKLAVIGVFCAFGLRFMFGPDLGPGLDQLQPFVPEETGWLGILSAMGITFIAFEGYEIIVQAGEEVKDPRRNVPKAVLWSLVIVVPVYMLVAFVLVGAADSRLLVEGLRTAGQGLPDGLSAQSENWQILRHVGELGLARTAAQFIPYGAVLILAGGMLSTMSALNATTFSSTRVAFAMGRDRNLPDAFGRVHATTRTPYVALAATAVLIGLMVAFVPITTVAAAADIMFLLLFLQVNVAVMTLRKKYGDKLAYGYLMPFYPAIPVLSIGLLLTLAVFMFHHYPSAWGYVLGWMALGFLLFRFYAREREREEEAPPVLAEESPMDLKPRSVLVAVADFEGARSLIRLGARIAGIQESELILLHTLNVPRQLPLRAGAAFAGEGRKILDQAREYAVRYSVPVRTVIRVGHSPATAILTTAQAKHTDYLIMGWHRRLASSRRGLGHNIDAVLKASNCHAVVVQDRSEEAPEKILVPVANPRTAPLALGVAACLLEGRRGSITVLHLSEKELSAEDQEEFSRQIHAQAVAEDRPEPTALFDESSPLTLEFATHRGSVASAIVRRSKSYDRLVLGSSPGGWLQRRVLGDLSRRVARLAPCPVILVRPHEPGVKFEVQRFFQFFHELEEEGQPQEG